MALLCLVPACSTSEQLLPPPPAAGVVVAVRDADLRARGAVAQAGPSSPARQAPGPMLYPGAEDPPAPSSRDGRVTRVATAEPGAAVQGSGVEMNFEAADIQMVAKTLLND